MRIDHLLRDGHAHLSCEVFPPKAFSGMEQAAAVSREIAALSPAYISVTYGAAGTTAGLTLELAQAVAASGVTPLCHLTCRQATQTQAKQLLTQLQQAGLENVLALRGDLPQDGRAVSGDFHHAADLIRLVRASGDFCIGAACYPEGHPESESISQDMDFLKAKVDAGADFLTTQMFFDNERLYRFLERAARWGIHVPVVAGIMPITDARMLRRTLELSGAALPPEFLALAARYGEDPAGMAQAGVDYAVRQMEDLLAHGVKHLHLYTMNKPWIARTVFAALSPSIRHERL